MLTSIRSINPATGEVLKEYPEMTSGEIDVILSQSSEAFKEWSISPFSERAKVLHNAANILRERKEELSRLCSLEMGKLFREGVIEVELCANIFDYYANNGEEFLADTPIEATGGNAYISYEPIGTILSVQPWNFPFSQLTRAVAPTLMAGNTVVLKHASNVPQVAEQMEKILLEAGAPQGVYTNLFIPGAKVEGVVADPRIKGVCLTGSAPAGASVASEAGKHLKKSTLELGGSDPFIVMPDADLDKAVQMVVAGRIRNAGQVCVSPKRIFVLSTVFEQFMEKAKSQVESTVIGDPLDPATGLGPLSSVKARDKVIEQVETAVSQGATLVTGGKSIEGPGAFMEPAILTHITKSMDVYSEEVFGPVLMVYSVKDMDEAVELANDTEYGLGATVFGTDIGEAEKVARRIRTGMAFVNRIPGSNPELPFGGTKQSGYGRELSLLGIREFVNQKLVFLNAPS